MGLSTKLIVSSAVAGAALTMYVRTRHQRTGEGYLSIVRQLPGDALRWAGDTRVAGRQGARGRQDRRARATTRSSPGSSTPPARPPAPEVSHG